MTEIIVFVIVVFALEFLFVKFIRKKFNITVYPNSERYINQTHKQSERILLLIAVTLFILSYFFNYLIVGFAVTLLYALVYRAYMEFRFEREEREYVITIVKSLAFLVVITGAPLIYFA
ncbi:DUF4181 domain-containing protein [Ornithinibacillus halotolerans]|uniref:DUF4181 domain-containing protein n=1 Tax=Ornithinibacillus halotolerans TaxID=1274357 RepID=A0A916WFN9_9BACI|nr:DUF4181 domain-containing protein [Ornithinibacillus halotolerans]GGA92978.1 hypothetical protein GCM10008025_39220 [Ornithinibacillus halotolerans]